MSSKVSIIIPIYNTEKYLEECLESLTLGSNKDANAEILCINDGSNDNSVNIIKSFMQKDTRFKLIEKENEGVSIARNVGIKAATGDYIMFLDSDDYFQPNAIEIALNQMLNKDADIGIFKYDYLIDGQLQEPRMNNRIDEFKGCSNPYEYLELQATVWNQIYKTSFLKDNNILFLEGCKNTEDGVFGFCCVFKKPKYTIISDKLYVYRRFVDGSATGKMDSVKNNQFTFEKFHSMEIFKEQPLSVQLKVVQKFLGTMIYALERFPNKKDQKILKEDIREFLKSFEYKYHAAHLRHLFEYNKLKNICKESYLKKLLLKQF